MPDGGPGRVGRSPEGVLTDMPHVSFVDRGDGSLVVTTSSFRLDVYPAGSAGSVWWFGDVENRSAEIYCHPRIEATFDFVRVDATISAPPYRVGTNTVSTPCIPPGGTASFWGLENDVSPTLLEQLAEVRYFVDASAYHFVDVVPHFDAPVLENVRVVETEAGDFGIQADARVPGGDIFNLRYDFYPRDARGLLIDQFPAFHLANLYAGQRFELATNQGAEVPFVAWAAYSSFIVGRDTDPFLPSLGPRESPDPEREAWEATLARLEAKREEAGR